MTASSYRDFLDEQAARWIDAQPCPRRFLHPVPNIMLETPRDYAAALDYEARAVERDAKVARQREAAAGRLRVAIDSRVAALGLAAGARAEVYVGRGGAFVVAVDGAIVAP